MFPELWITNAVRNYSDKIITRTHPIITEITNFFKPHKDLISTEYAELVNVNVVKESPSIENESDQQAKCRIVYQHNDDIDYLKKICFQLCKNKCQRFVKFFHNYMQI